MFKSLRLCACLLTFLLLIVCIGMAQGGEEDILEQANALRVLRGFPLHELPGSVPTWYVSSAEARARQYQQSLQPALTWVGEQLHETLPIDLAVLDHASYEKMNAVPWPLPYALDNFNYLVFPDHIDELLGPEPKAKAPGEYITYHESGHVFAHRLGIVSGNAFVNELIANVFMAGYIHAERHDLNWVLEGPPNSDKYPRYTSLADLDYVYFPGVGPANYVWYQWHLQRIAGFLTMDQGFASVMQNLKAEFPADKKKQETLDQILAHLDRIRPGLKNILGILAGPSTLAHITPIACPSSGKSSVGKEGVIAVRNDQAEAMVLKASDGHSEILPPGGWTAFNLKAGETILLPNGICIVAGDEPGLAVVGK